MLDMKLLSLAITFIIGINGECVDSHPDHVISWITSNKINSDVIYLGNKINSAQCQVACQDLNHLCDKSSSDVITNDGASVSFDHTNCAVTIHANAGNNDPIVAITPNLISNQYRIDVELEVNSGNAAGFYFKSNNDNSNFYDYYIEFEAGSRSSSRLVAAYHHPDPGITTTFSTTFPPIALNTKHTLSVHVDGNSYTTYFDGSSYKGGSFISEFIDNYAGIYTNGADAIFHSFKVDVMDDEGDKICAAYVYNDDGDCYGYYGTDMTAMESSLSPNSTYYSAIIYPVTCPQTTKDPTSNPIPQTTKSPTNGPIKSLTNVPTQSPTNIPTKSPTNDPTKSPTNNSTEGPSYSPTKDIISTSAITEDETKVETNSNDLGDGDSSEKEAGLWWVGPAVIVPILLVFMCGCIWYRIKKKSAQNSKLMAAQHAPRKPPHVQNEIQPNVVQNGEESSDSVGLVGVYKGNRGKTKRETTRTKKASIETAGYGMEGVQRKVIKQTKTNTIATRQDSNTTTGHAGDV